MADNDFKNDFFEDRCSGTKKKNPRLVNRYSEGGARSHLKVPIEYAVILAIVILTLMTVSYAVGVKNGKSVVKMEYMREDGPEAPAESNAKEPDINVVLETVKTDNEILTRDENAEESGESEESEIIGFSLPEDSVEVIPEEQKQYKKTEDVSLFDETEYIICLASFKDENSAVRDTSVLKDRGIKTRTTKKGQWYQLYASGYRTIDEARAAKEELIENYKDCYIKRIK